MARSFANTASYVDYITYGVPPVAGLSQCSMVARLSGNSSGVDYSGAFNVVSPSNASDVGFGRWSSGGMFFTFRNADNTKIQYFAFGSYDGTMRSVVMTFDGGATPKTKAYVNGVNQSLAGGSITNTTIGSGHTSAIVSQLVARGWHGVIAELAIYNRVITEAEALQHAAGYSCRNFPRGLIFYAPLIREVHDIAGGLTGTITGTTVADHPRIYA